MSIKRILMACLPLLLSSACGESIKQSSRSLRIGLSSSVTEQRADISSAWMRISDITLLANCVTPYRVGQSSGPIVVDLAEADAEVELQFPEGDFCGLEFQVAPLQSASEGLPPELQGQSIWVRGNSTEGDYSFEVASSMEGLVRVQYEDEFPLHQQGGDLRLSFETNAWFEGIDWADATQDVDGSVYLDRIDNVALLSVFERNLQVSTSLRQEVQRQVSPKKFPGPCVEHVIGQADDYEIRYSYNDQRKLIEEVAGGAEPYEIRYSYAQGRLETKTRYLSDPHQVQYRYDSAGRLELEARSPTEAYTKTYTYDRFGKLIYVEQVGTNPHEIFYEYEQSGRLAFEREVTDAGTIERSYDYDRQGRLASIRQDGGNSFEVSYFYSNNGASDRPEMETRLNDEPYTKHFLYDASGNLVRTVQQGDSMFTTYYDYSCFQ